MLKKEVATPSSVVLVELIFVCISLQAATPSSAASLINWITVSTTHLAQWTRHSKKFLTRCLASTRTTSCSTIFSSGTFLFTSRAHANAQLNGNSRTRVAHLVTSRQQLCSAPCNAQLSGKSRRRVAHLIASRQQLCFAPSAGYRLFIDLVPTVVYRNRAGRSGWTLSFRSPSLEACFLRNWRRSTIFSIFCTDSTLGQ